MHAGTSVGVRESGEFVFQVDGHFAVRSLRRRSRISAHH
jgi:hypothetical protein